VTIGELFGWMRTLLEQFGIYTTVVSFFTATLIIIGTGVILRSLRGG
jgi:hypothetical protein